MQYDLQVTLGRAPESTFETYLQMSAQISIALSAHGTISSHQWQQNFKGNFSLELSFIRSSLRTGASLKSQYKEDSMLLMFQLVAFSPCLKELFRICSSPQLPMHSIWKLC
ncbi:hypothetical protein AVEN_200535-1 [Araneus ventricosus]|uniref:Uncharacterized protein n=1 Tax=Araneus ventricosus TaxID=182803 RepID=A0A4Y2TQY3_ARAVE|nr:hypothetical protein AVEN_200535-1 [Araneus ventricosus]